MPIRQSITAISIAFAVSLVSGSVIHCYSMAPVGENGQLPLAISKPLEKGNGVLPIDCCKAGTCQCK